MRYKELQITPSVPPAAYRYKLSVYYWRSDYDEVRELLAEFGCTAHIRTRGEEAKALTQEAGFKARRWIVETTQTLVKV